LDIHPTGEAIARAQLNSGAIGWPDGHIDPWDHIECAMALSVCGLRPQARRAYDWLRATQRADGSWARSVSSSGEVLDHGAESHHAAYIAVGVWHEFLVSGDASFAVSMWPVVRQALTWTLELRRADGSFAWERDASGGAGSFALLSGCSSILQGLRCGVALSKLADEPRPDWETAADSLAAVLQSGSTAFADKSRFSMDWYYPVLGGALRGPSGVSRLMESWDRFVVPGLGVRCVSDQPWVTVAETCELVLALDACGLRSSAVSLFEMVHRLREPDGSYWTGWQYVNQAYFPDERSSWTAAAVVLAADALGGYTGGSGLFRDCGGEAQACPR
jgi:hypothetical protein